MNVENIWKIIKNRYRLSSKIQMNFELGFPEYRIAKCRFTTQHAYQVRTQKVSLSLKGFVFSDTIPLSWFTSSALIPWEKMKTMDISSSAPVIDGILNTPLSTELNEADIDVEYCTIQLEDPEDITITLPWSKKFSEYIQKNKLWRK